ncbi:MAG TPA: long-chain-fatty-acid--CoA ligase [Xanthomonadales bacterium]|nr:long-chain-fatty-acid--CoA ligase [Xanthomonadales bacterium]
MDKRRALTMNLMQLIEHCAQTNGHALAVLDEQEGRTWVETRNRIACLAAGLQGLGCDDRDRVGILALNSSRYFEALFAIAWAGGVMVPINIRLAAPEVVFWLEDSGAKILCVDAAFAPMVATLRDRVGALEVIVYMGEGVIPDGMQSFESLIDDHSVVDPSGRGGEDLSGLFYTGGTTGRSKGVMLSHNNQVINALQTSRWFEMNHGSVYLNNAPMFHAANMIGMLNATLIGAAHVFAPRFDPELTMQLIEAHRVTHSVMVPTMINMLIHHPDIGNYDLSSLELLLYGGSPMAEAIIVRAEAVLPGLRMIQAYGQTETSPVLTLLGPERHVFSGPLAGKTRSAGQAVPCTDIVIMDENDGLLASGEIGEICARGPNIMRGYWNLPEQTAETVRDGWIHTGDSGYLDEDGFLFISDRVKDMIVSGGENIYSIEVENALYQHPAVEACAVIGIPSGKWGEKVHAVVILAEDQEADEQVLIAHCRELIAGFKCPRGISFRTEPMPLSGAGKILKRELREPFWKGLGRQVG